MEGKHTPNVCKRQHVTTAPQGHSVFHFSTNKDQCQVRLSCKAAARGRHVGVACPSQQPNRGITKCCHPLGNIPTADLRTIFIEGHIADPMRLVFNLPMAAYECEQPLGCSPLG